MQNLTPLAELLDATANLLAAIAWPLIVFFILVRPKMLIALTAELKELLKNVKTVEAFGIKLSKEVDHRADAVVAADPNAGRSPTPQQVENAKMMEEFARGSDLSIIRHQVLDLARDYEHIRAFMDYGVEKTRKMEMVITKMRILALTAIPLLPELTRSTSLGARLAAIATLQVQPSIEYLQWLAERLADDPGSFHGYHSAVALRCAAHMLGESDHEAIRRAIETARKLAKNESKVADAFDVLNEAERYLDMSITN